MRRTLSFIAIASLVAGSVLISAPAANAAPTLASTAERFADSAFTLSDITDLVPGQRISITLTQTPGGDPLCASYAEPGGLPTWTETPDGQPVVLYLALYTVDNGTYSLVDSPLQALNSVTYTTGAQLLTAEIDLEPLSVPGPYFAYAYCQDQSESKQYSTTELGVTFTPFTLSPAQTPAGTTTTLSIPRPDLFCNIDTDPEGHSVVLFFASTAEDLWNVRGSFFTWPTNWSEDAAGFGSFNPTTSEPITVPITLPSDIAEGTYFVATQCVGPREGDPGDYFYPEAGSARYFGTLTVGPLAEPEPEITPEPEPEITPEPEVTQRPTPTPTPELARTGTNDAWGIGLLALGLLTSGVLLVSRTRRTRLQ